MTRKTREQKDTPDSEAPRRRDPREPDMTQDVKERMPRGRVVKRMKRQHERQISRARDAKKDMQLGQEVVVASKS